MNSHRMATTAKLRHEFDKRTDNNFQATEVLRNNEKLWKEMGGPNPDELFDPSYQSLGEAQLAANKLQIILDKGGKDRDQLAQCAEEIVEAVSQIRLTGWEAIYRERFSITPMAAWDAIVRNTEALIGRRDRESEMRRKRLAEPQRERRDGDQPDEQSEADIFGTDFGKFENIVGQRPFGWNKAVSRASEICLDEMRTLFELHYENVHVDAHRHCKKPPTRKSVYKVLPSCKKDYQRNLSVRLAVPRAVKEIFQQMHDETNWGKLEQFRLVLQDICQGTTEVHIANQEESEALATAIRSGPGNNHGIEVGDGFKKIPAGSFVEIPKAFKGRHSKLETTAQIYERSGLEKLTVLMRPLGSKRRPAMLDAFSKSLFGKSSARELAEKNGWAADEMFNKMALVLYDQLFLELADEWSRKGKANLTSSDTNDLARYFLIGMHIGQKPIFENICANCGCFLSGITNESDGLSNKCSGLPRDKDGHPMQNDDGSYQVNAQPPTQS